MEIDTNEISEIFSPALNDVYQQQFRKLVSRIENAFPNYRELLITQELKELDADACEDDFERLKYIASLHVLYDLIQQGWRLEPQKDNSLRLTIQSGSCNDKSYIRHRLNSERQAQFNNPSVMRFIEKMEQPKKHNGQIVSIRNLIGSSEHIIHAIQNGKLVIDLIALVS